MTEFEIDIQPATLADVPLILSFIRALAEYERLSDHVVATETTVRETLFGSRPDAESVIARVDETPVGFAVLRDPIACKPAVMAETDQYVAFGSEYRALAGLPGIDVARVWEPEPSTVYFWER